ncbi:MAG: MMPL family transporter [Ferrimicrobium sp.]|uniref:MMPL family transporter n=1 Tax=Ferrimicrobium acidiphilum TaxID=121039 RepID=A0ABV3Y5X7_9ACTN|nr:MMPL family transporter [Ferrimicrobium acidiphilum]
MMSRLFSHLGRFTIRFRWAVVAVWLVGTISAAVLLPSLGSQVQEQNSSFLPANAPSERAAALAAPLERKGVTPVLVVATSTSKHFDTADQRTLARIATAAKVVPTVVKVFNAGLAPDGRAAELIVQSSVSPKGTPATRLIDNLDKIVSTTPSPPGFTAHLAGSLAINVANQHASGHQTKQAQALSILFILVMLFLIFRSVLAPLVTLLPAALVVTLASSVIASTGVPISSFAQILLVVLVLGAGTDYGLFLVFRVREELRQGLAPHASVVRAVTKVGESITFSAGTVIVALLSLLLARFGIYHDLGVPLAIAIGFMLLAGLTLLPALLAILGRAVFWPSKVTVHADQEGIWHRITTRLLRRPVVTLGVALLFFGLLATGVAGYHPSGFGGNTSAPPGTDASLGQAALLANFPKASANPTNLVFKLAKPAWVDPQVLTVLQSHLHSSGQFTRLLGPLDPNGTVLKPAELATLHRQLGPPGLLPVAPAAGTGVPLDVYEAYRSTSQLVSANGRTIQFEATLAAGSPTTTQAMLAIPAIRSAVADAAHAVRAQASGVAGEAAGIYDVNQISSNDLLRIVPLAILLIGLLLVLVLRSLVAPLYLIASVALSYLAALGLTVLLFVDIDGQSGLVFILPFLMFIFLLALGEDYNILVMSRIREEAQRLPLRRAIAKAIGATGPTVTSAGLVLAGTFGVLVIVSGGGANASQYQAIGAGLALGILMDTFLVRTVMIPSVVAILGRYNWWPATPSQNEEPNTRKSVIANDTDESATDDRVIM